MSKYQMLRVCTALMITVMCSQAGYGQESDTSAAVAAREHVAKGIKIKGKIVDGQTHLPIVGATVGVPEFSASLTDRNGAFSIAVPNVRTNIQIEMAGYHTKIFPANRTDLTVVLFPETANSFYTTSSTPFGEKNSLQVVGAAEVLNFHGAWENNAETVDNYIQGKVAGVQVVRKSGTPSMGANVMLRGFNSLYTHSQPLYIVDGLIYNSEYHSSSITSGHENNPLQNIDVRDIKSVTVLKDAVSTSIYGAKAANGVIIINTNRAEELATKIDFEITTGVNQKPGKMPVMNSFNYRSYLNDILASNSVFDGEAIANYPFNNDNPNFLQYSVFHNNTNWQDEIFKAGVDKSYYLKVTGGDNIAKYNLSVGYANDLGIIANTKQNKYTARFNGDLSLTKKLSAQTNVSLGYGQQDLKDQGFSANTNPIFLALIKAPFLSTNEVAEDGQISPNYADADYFGFSSPLQLLYNGINNKKSYRFLGGVNFDYKLNSKLKFSNITGVTYDKAQENFFIPANGVSTEVINNNIVTSRLGSQVARYFSVYNDLRALYTSSYSNLYKLNAFAGIRYHHHNAEQDYALGYNSATDDLVSIGNSDASIRNFGGQIGKWANITYYGAVDFNIDNRFILNGSISLDGSSRFGDKAEGGVNLGGHPYGVFPAIGAAWIVSSENFMKDISNLNLLKYRISYGLVGNDDIGNFNARQSYVSQNFLGVQGLVREGVSNPYLRWETVRKFNTGLDLSMFKERFNLSLDFYQNTTDKMLAYQIGNSLSGVSYYLDNSGGMKTNGLELRLFGRIKSGKIAWDASLNVGSYKNKITDLPETAFTEVGGATFITQIGSPSNSFYGYKFKGVYSTANDASAAGLSVRDAAGNLIPFQAGDAIFEERVRDGVIDENDRFILGDPNPDIYGGISNSLSFKNWRLGALFTFSLGNEAYNYSRAVLESGNYIYNQTDALLSRWKAEGQVTNTPRVSFNDPMGNARFSNRWIEDASYLRLRQLSLEYQFNLNKGLLNYLKIYGTANNLLTFSKYLGYDPEFSMNTDVFRQGIDATVEPQVRSFQIGVRLGL